MDRLVVVLQSSRNVKAVKTILEVRGLLDRTRKISRTEDGNFELTTLVELGNKDELTEVLKTAGIPTELTIESRAINTQDLQMADTSIAEILESFFLTTGNETLSSLLRSDLFQKCLETIPKRWSSYPPLLLCPPGTFETECWKQLLQDHHGRFFEYLLERKFKAHTHVAVNNPIVEHDVMRRPFNLVPVLGDFGPVITNSAYDNPSESDFEQEFWCHCTQNGIFQTWAPRFTMFSRGNIREKSRILETFTDIKDKVVLDLYAGIGYFTLCYLKKGAKTLFCWEINPWSVRGLIQGAIKNKFKHKLIKHDDVLTQLDEGIKLYIFQESNEHAPERLQTLLRNKKMPISHVNLGLLPSSSPSWNLAVSVVSKFNDFDENDHTDLHIHENVGISNLTDFYESTPKELQLMNTSLSFEGKHLEKIKTFAPDVWHICADVRVSRKENE
ncbi:unnamed protein product [Kuraishia capsulata CBS 1993]|uniref:tRNA wybutosine-synthesizing protein 2 n=1 Tax=Kuraishia capsulata CBS 1993 TaxID=1382522 RepID=W6MUC0_9ASCO|nr:uncharacterized protein KUCA_T00005099001 [Kuraishia capsulata CBS 1993]CDK29112.1 unnamed protein product [Kuraishia capsulata CBS 1993]